jgi:hypothetical protein
MTFVQLGRGLSDQEIKTRLIMCLADNLTLPVHFVADIEMLPENYDWPRRGVLEIGWLRW